jgi:hypothetical protein
MQWLQLRMHADGTLNSTQLKEGGASLLASDGTVSPILQFLRNLSLFPSHYYACTNNLGLFGDLDKCIAMLTSSVKSGLLPTVNTTHYYKQNCFYISLIVRGNIYEYNNSPSFLLSAAGVTGQRVVSPTQLAVSL